MSLQVWLPLAGNLNNFGLDGWKPSGTGITYTNNGKIGQARSAGAITIPANVCARIFNNGGMSIAFWVYINLDDGATNNRMMFFGNEPTRWFGLFNYPTANDFHWCWANTPKGGSYSETAGVTFVSVGVKAGILPTKKWIHIAVTCDNKFFTMYLNGEQQIHQACNPMNVADYSQDTVLVSNNSNYYYNDYRIYDHALSAKEVKELAKGLVLHYRLAGPGRPNLLTGTGPNDSGWNINQSGATITRTVTSDCTTFNITATTTKWFLYTHNLPASVRSSLKTNTIYTYSFETKSTANFNFNISIRCNDGTNPISNNQNISIVGDNEWHKYSVQLTTIASFSSMSRTDQYFYMTGGNVISTVSFRNAKLEEGSAATSWCPNPADTLYSAMGYSAGIEYDCSGYKHNGTPVSATVRPVWDVDSPRYTTSFNYFGNANQANYTTSKDMNFIDNFSWAIWIKPNYTSGNIQYVFTGGRADAGGYGYGLQVASTTSCTIFYGNNGRYTINAKSGEWHHVAFTKSGTTCKCYLDGMLVSANTFNGTNPSYSDGNGVGIGCFHYAGNIYPYFGKASDFRIYATALSAEDIAELYHTAAIVDNQNNLYAYEYIEEEAHI